MICSSESAALNLSRGTACSQAKGTKTSELVVVLKDQAHPHKSAFWGAGEGQYINKNLNTELIKYARVTKDHAGDA
jgi:hypothetical protein